MFISPWVQCPQVQKNIGSRSVWRRHIKKRTLPHSHNFLLFRYIPIGGNHSPCENAHQQPQCPWVCLDKSCATHGPSWSQQMIPISMENLTFQTLGFGTWCLETMVPNVPARTISRMKSFFFRLLFPGNGHEHHGFSHQIWQLCSCFPHMSQFRTSHGFPCQTAWHSKKNSQTRAPCPDCRPAAKNFQKMMLPGFHVSFGSILFENMRVLLMQLLTNVE